MSRPLTIPWLPVPGFEGLYEIGANGQVRSLPRMVGTRWPGSQKRLKGRVLKFSPDSYGYGMLRLYRGDGTSEKFMTHQLLLEVFVGPRPEGAFACHQDGDKANNAVENLRWDTASSNTRDNVRLGVHNNARKTHCKHGHAYDAANTYRTRQGHRRCRTCSRVFKAIRRAAA